MCQRHMILACDVSACVIVIIVVSVKCGGISQVCQGRREMGMTNMTQTR